MRQGGDDTDPIIQAVVTAAPRRAADSFDAIRPPVVRMPEELETVSGEGAPICIKQLDLRIDSGMPFRDVGGTATLGSPIPSPASTTSHNPAYTNCCPGIGLESAKAKIPSSQPKISGPQRRLTSGSRPQPLQILTFAGVLGLLEKVSYCEH